MYVTHRPLRLRLLYELFASGPWLYSHFRGIARSTEHELVSLCPSFRMAADGSMLSI